ncbi:UNVERIFIED_CONTAM: hypothetical protein Sradi_6868500 [Sesamum radiatum]|uniref:Uncharacterized protein n=1 Tax=Sesamum radiatum TaxID=300843 RepID=A0AAW2JJZ8_SESRA
MMVGKARAVWRRAGAKGRKGEKLQKREGVREEFEARKGSKRKQTERIQCDGRVADGDTAMVIGRWAGSK